MFCLEVIAHGLEAAPALPAPWVPRPDPGGVLPQAQAPALTREGYCPKHKPPKAPRRASAEYHGWYSLPIWTDDLRPAQLLREPFCRECAARYPPGDPRHRTWASVVDHITPHRGDWAKFIDPTNLQSLCKTCHDRKTAREQAEERQNRGGI